MTYASLGTATLENGKACWVVGDLSGSMTLSLRARVDSDAPAGSLTNNATATSDDAGHAKADATVKVPAKHGVKGKLKARPASPASAHHRTLLTTGSAPSAGYDGALPVLVSEPEHVRPRYRPIAWRAEPTSR